MIATHATVTGLTSRIKNVQHKLYTNNFLSPDLLDNLHSKTIYCSGTVRPNQKGKPQEFLGGGSERG
jgi:hypothetical protein